MTTRMLQHQRFATRAAFTLVESLLVVSVLGLAMSVAAINLAAGDEAIAFRGAVHDWIDLDARLRLRAREVGPIEVSVVEAVPFTIATSHDELRRTWRNGLAISIETGAQVADRLIFDRAGRTRDYRVHFRSGERAALVEFSGLSGTATLRTEVRP